MNAAGLTITFLALLFVVGVLLAVAFRR